MFSVLLVYQFFKGVFPVYSSNTMKHWHYTQDWCVCRILLNFQICTLTHWFKSNLFSFIFFGDYNIILPSSRFPHVLLLVCLSNSWPLCSLIILTCIQVYTHIFLNITSSVYTMLLLGMLSEPTSWYWITCWYALPPGELFVLLLAFLVAYF